MKAQFLEGRPWAQTRTGRGFPLIRPTAADVHWPDVVYSLAHINRFAGHVGEYSVAQHCVLVSENLPHGAKPYGLLHDAHEFVTGDITTPAARALAAIADRWAGGLAGSYVSAAIKALKSNIDSAIHIAADLTWPIPQEIAEAVHIADQRALMTEARDLMAPAPASWGYDHVVPFSETIERWPADKALARYMWELQRHSIALI